MKVVIIGAGFTGLSAGYHLSQKGVQVEIFEKESFVGGLSGAFKQKNWDWPVEQLFHHVFPTDKALFQLLGKLKITSKLFFRRPITSVFVGNQILPFDSPSSFLKFPHLSWPEKLRMGATLASFRFNPFWTIFEKTTAAKLLPKLMGEKPYRLLWQPLFAGKFGNDADQISAAWFWARIKKRSPKLGYLEGGFQTLIDALVKEIKKGGGKIHLRTEVISINFQHNTLRVIRRSPADGGGESRSKVLSLLKSSRLRSNNNDFTYSFDKILVTTPIPVFLKMAPKLSSSYLKNLSSLGMIGAINLVLELKKPFLTGNTYWLNVNDALFPFCAVVEHTNFIDKKHYGNNHIVYVGGYYPPEHRFFKMNKKELLGEFYPYLKKINPHFNISRITPACAVRYHVSHSLYAQPIIPVNYSKIKPSMTTLYPNLFLATLHHVYPWDRGVNYAVELGKEATDEITK